MRSNKLLRKAITDKESVWLIRREGEEESAAQTPSLIFITASNFISLIYNTQFYLVKLANMHYMNIKYELLLHWHLLILFCQSSTNQKNGYEH